MVRRGPARGRSNSCKWCHLSYGRQDFVVSVQAERPERRAGFLIIRRSWVRAPPAPHDLTCDDALLSASCDPAADAFSGPDGRRNALQWASGAIDLILGSAAIVAIVAVVVLIRRQTSKLAARAEAAYPGPLTRSPPRRWKPSRHHHLAGPQPAIGKLWRAHWDKFTLFLAFWIRRQGTDSISNGVDNSKRQGPGHLCCCSRWLPISGPGRFCHQGRLRVRSPGTLTCARCPAARSALDAVPGRITIRRQSSGPFAASVVMLVAGHP
jgi:hypothetical protein